MIKAKTVDAVRERKREGELFSINIERSLVEHASISNLIKIQKGRNTFIDDIKMADYK